MSTATTTLLALLYVLFLTPVHAWAPAMHPDPTKLPKVLEFAEKAWKFPKVETLHYPILPQQFQDDHVWSKREEPATNENDHFYFDGHTSIALKWPIRQAFLVSRPNSKDHLVSKIVSVPSEEECDDYYYDDAGDVLCWATSTRSSSRARLDETTELNKAPDKTTECDYGYFDRIGGEELCWLSFFDRGQTVAAHKTMVRHPGLPDDDENCQNPYFDDMGNQACWAF